MFVYNSLRLFEIVFLNHWNFFWWGFLYSTSISCRLLLNRFLIHLFKGFGVALIFSRWLVRLSFRTSSWNYWLMFLNNLWLARWLFEAFVLNNWIVVLNLSDKIFNFILPIGFKLLSGFFTIWFLRFALLFLLLNFQFGRLLFFEKFGCFFGLLHSDTLFLKFLGIFFFFQGFLVGNSLLSFLFSLSLFLSLSFFPLGLFLQSFLLSLLFLLVLFFLLLFSSEFCSFFLLSFLLSKLLSFYFLLSFSFFLLFKPLFL